jgi:CDP-paratose 2-epimerase
LKEQLMRQKTARIALITGGAGFIGSNLAERLLADPHVRVRLFDNFSREGVVHNLAWLRSLSGSSRLEVIRGDVRDARAVEQAVSGVSEIYHLAAQVAVTTSLEDPLRDFEVNTKGTFHVLEAARRSGCRPFLLFTSTNKVYGSLSRVAVEVHDGRYRAVQRDFRGVDEREPLDFHSPYGCSKGAADQYVHDYARIFGLPTVVFRMSCIAGPRQFGNEDQGWVAHFLYSTLLGRPISIYGDGHQVRDVLHVHDLVDAMMAARGAEERSRGEIFNLGGGIERAVSVMEMLREIQNKTGVAPRCDFFEVRPGDQPLYISDTAKLQRSIGWRPRRSVTDTLEAIHGFWLHNRELIASAGSRTLTPASSLQMEVA